MSIVLTKDVWISGVKQVSGTALTLGASLEADLVHRGCATFSSKYSGITEADTGRHAAEHAAMGGAIYASAYGVESGTSSDQSAKINQMYVTLAAENFYGTVVFPSGTIKQDLPVVVTGRVPPWEPLNSNNDEVVCRMASDGVTVFDYSGGVQGTTAWTFKTSGTGQATMLEFKGIRWNGPGVSAGRTTLSVAAAAGGASIHVPLGSGIVVGDAICIDADVIAAAPSTTSPPWWATVTGVSDGADTTLTFANQQLPTNFVGTIGNIVSFFKQTRALQIGGSQSVYQEIYQGVTFDNSCAWSNWFSAVALNDVTGLRFRNEPIFKYCMFGVEVGYNCDNILMEMPWIHYQHGSQTGTCTTGQRTVTGLTTSQLDVGCSLSDLTATDYSVAGALAFPEHAVIVSIDSASQVTMSHVSAVTGSRTLQACMGILFTAGKGTSAWYPLQPASVGGNGYRNNLDNLYIEAPLASCARMVYHIDGGVNSQVKIADFYIELCQRLCMVGNQGYPNATASYLVKGGIIGSVESCISPVIEQLHGNNGPKWEITDINGAGSSPRNAIVRCRNLGNIKWERNNFSARTASKKLLELDRYLFDGVSPTVSDVAMFSLTGKPSYMTNTITGVSGNYTVEPAYFDVHDISMVGATTVQAASQGAIIGKQQTFILRQDGTGGRIPTFAAHFYTESGTALGATLGSGTANKVLIAEFRNIGGSGYGKYVLTNVPAWM